MVPLVIWVFIDETEPPPGTLRALSFERMESCHGLRGIRLTCVSARCGWRSSIRRVSVAVPGDLRDRRKLGAHHELLPIWVRRAEVDERRRPRLTTDDW